MYIYIYLTTAASWITQYATNFKKQSAIESTARNINNFQEIVIEKSSYEKYLKNRVVVNVT